MNKITTNFQPGKRGNFSFLITIGLSVMVISFLFSCSGISNHSYKKCNQERALLQKQNKDWEKKYSILKQKLVKWEKDYQEIANKVNQQTKQIDQQAKQIDQRAKQFDLQTKQIESLLKWKQEYEKKQKEGR